NAHRRFHLDPLRRPTDPNAAARSPRGPDIGASAAVDVSHATVADGDAPGSQRCLRRLPDRRQCGLCPLCPQGRTRSGLRPGRCRTTGRPGCRNPHRRVLRRVVRDRGRHHGGGCHRRAGRSPARPPLVTSGRGDQLPDERGLIALHPDRGRCLRGTGVGTGSRVGPRLTCFVVLALLTRGTEFTFPPTRVGSNTPRHLTRLSLEVTDDLLQQRTLLTLCRHDQPGQQVDEDPAEAENLEDHERQPDDGGVDTDELGDPPTHTGQESIAVTATETLVLIHVFRLPVSYDVSYRGQPWTSPEASRTFR